jgi:hypothetical protein
LLADSKLRPPRERISERTHLDVPSFKTRPAKRPTSLPATLRDNTTGTTILPKVWATNSTWVQDSANITAGHSYALTLISHDDNYVGDATYTLFDNVTTQ